MYRITVKQGNFEYALINFNLSGMAGNGNIGDFSYKFAAKRTLSQPGYDISLDSVNNPTQFITQSVSSLMVVLTPDNTVNLLPGAYFWEMQLQYLSGSMPIYISPPTQYGDLIVLEAIL